MHVEPSIFKAYDIRGLCPGQIDGEAAYAIARGYAALLKSREGGRKQKVAVGSDMRGTGPELKKRVIDGLLESGFDVDDIGLVSTPTFYFAVAYFGYDGGIQVSASHNPKEWNGFKLVGKRGEPIGFDTGIREIKRMIEEDALPPIEDGAAHGRASSRTGIVEAELEAQVLTQKETLSSIKPCKVIIDTGNGMGALDMKALFAKLPVTVEWMNETLDGSFPGHPADPLVEENTVDLRKWVVSSDADLGIASDGDGDRYFFFDEKGAAIPQSIVRGLAAQIELKDHPGAKVVYDVRPGKITTDLIEQAGGIAVLAPVGHSLIKAKMLAEDAIFGGESSGHFFYKLPYGTFEAPMILVTKFLAFLSVQGKPASEVVAPYKRYAHSGEINSKLASREKGLEKIEEIKKKYADGEQMTLDGLTVDYPTYWFNLRLSNTEPLIRLTVEAVDSATMEAKRDELLALIRA